MSEPSNRLVREWAAFAVAASVSRFVPVPLLDDAIKERATRLAVTRTLRHHGREFDPDDVEALWAGADGVFATARKYAVGIPAKVALFPVRKYVAVLGAVKGVPSDVLAVLLLARTVHRRLEAGGLADAPGPAGARHRKAEAKRVRKAYESVLDDMDLRLISGALQDGLSTGRNLSTAAVAQARRLLDRDRTDEAPPQPDADLDDGAGEVERVLARPEISELMTEFDRRVDAYLAEHA